MYGKNKISWLGVMENGLKQEYMFEKKLISAQN